MVTVTAESFTDYSPCPRVVLTVSGLGTEQSIVSVWRISGGDRASVSGARRVPFTDSGYVTDYYAPLGVPVAYEFEVVSGGLGPSRTQSNSVTVDAGEGCIMDPLMPFSAITIAGPYGAAGRPTFAEAAMSSIERKAEVSQFKIMGSSEPFSLFGQRAAASNVNLSLVTDDHEEGGRLRGLFESSAQLLVRIPASWQSALPALCFMAVGVVSEKPLEGGQGGPLTLWELVGDVVSAPTLKPLTGGTTFGDVALFYGTFQAKHDAVVAAASVAGVQPTFLFDLMHPLG